jgi:hypothetical protein
MTIIPFISIILSLFAGVALGMGTMCLVQFSKDAGQRFAALGFQDQDAFNDTLGAADAAKSGIVTDALPAENIIGFTEAMRYAELRQFSIQIYDQNGEPIAPEHLTGDKLDVFIDGLRFNRKDMEDI